MSARVDDLHRRGRTSRSPRAITGVVACGLATLCLPGFPARHGPAAATSDSAGIVEGTVRLAGDSLPVPTVVVNSTDPGVCGREHSLRDLLVSRETRGIRYAIVSLVDIPAERIPERRPRRLVIDNRECRFVPHAAVATLGDTVVARNSDLTLHNTHFYGPMRSNIALPVQGMTVSRIALRTGIVTVLCDVHGWMKAYIRIDAHPFHAVTDILGRFRIEDVPPGRYTLELWHEKLGTRQREVTVEDGRVTSVRLEYPSPSR